MTTVVAIARDGVVVMGADSLTNVYERPVYGGAIKVRRVPLEGGGEALLGVSGAGALGDLYAYRLTLPALPVDAWHSHADLQQWAAQCAWSLTDLAREAGVTQDGQIDGNVLLGAAGQLWTVANYMAIPHPDGSAALGSGEGPALGALDALGTYVDDLAERVRQALHIAQARDKHTASPMHVEVLQALPAPDRED